MKTFFRFIKHILIFLFLTVITQVGGLIYLLYQPVSRKIKQRVKNKSKQRLVRLTAFTALYLLISWTIVPLAAKQFGRVPLPMFATTDAPIQPRHYFFLLANRNYVKPELKATIIKTAKALDKKYPNAKVLYLDGCFPFVDGMPLMPHLSHSDGKKLDIAFVYKHKETGKYTNKTPTWVGYGGSEMPESNEENRPEFCKKQGYFQYSVLKRLTPIIGKSSLEFDDKANSWLVQYLAKQPAVGKIFIEPHLKTRFGLRNVNKIRFHGCQAVRHDDHIHVQL